MWQRVLYILLLCSSLSAQGFLYSYIDPCNQILVRDNYNIQNQDGGFYVTYYNKSKFFTLQQVLNGELESWAERVYNDFEDLFPCAVRVAEEILSSVLASNATEQFNKSDVSNEVSQVNYGIKSSPAVDSSWVTSFNSIYTRESFDGKSRYDGNLSFTDDLSRFNASYGQGVNFLAKKQNQVISASGVFFKTFEGSDWLVSSSYAKSLVKKNAEVIVLTASYGSVSDNGFGNFSVLYGLRTPVEFGSFKMTFTNYVSYTLLRYYEGLNSGKQYLLLQSPIMLMPTLSFDFQLSQAFKVNLGFSMGYNTVVNDYGERTTTYSILFGTYF
jgi:hypothetical protein|tara:strand:+ start:30 stop:1013 length:984 start_codon:yes stop_codon:yes gene_type:complete